MRGKLYYSPVSGTSRGITPAGAGKTCPCSFPRRFCWDHPRRCGENRARSAAGFTKYGSPPQVRGKHPRGGCCFCPSRITPAGAGKTASGLHKAKGGQDHPRRCGENSAPQQPRASCAGSPPRMRGKRNNFLNVSRQPRITPADAGKTLKSFIVGRDTKDHPRGCGENVKHFLRLLTNIGSPPRMRGKQYPAHNAIATARITPADAGKTARHKGRWNSAWDHPRGCGENVCVGFVTARLPGSPPRMRGKPLRPQCGFLSAGITPADAGKTRR